jgi:hypothetical protein
MHDSGIDESQVSFAVFCIENVAEKLGLRGDEVFTLLSGSGILDDYILPSYDVLHTQGREYIVNDIIECMASKGLIK